MLVGMTLTLACGVRADYAAHLEPALQFQKFKGWGTSLAWWAHVVGGFPDAARRDYVEKTFDLEKGLGLNIVRYNIGGGENPLYLAPNKQFLQYRAAVPGYQSAPGQWNWDADANQRWMLKAAMAKGANQLEAFSNSPPYWMTKSGSVTGNQGGTDNLKNEADGQFADYLVGVVQHFHDAWSINFQTLEPFNEPDGNWWKFGHWQEGCFVEPEHQNAVIKAVGGALARTKLRTQVAASDDNSIDNAVRTFRAYDETALKMLNRINAHSYGGSARTQLATLAGAAGKEVWMSEYGDDDASGLTMSRVILKDLRDLHAVAWSYWQVVDNTGGWGFLKNPLKDQVTTAYTINKKYWVMGQYSKFIRPEFQIISIDDPNSVAALDAASRTLVIVTTNSSEKETRVTYDLSGFSRIGDSVASYRTSPTQNLEKLTALPINGNDAKNFVAIAPAKSVTTFVIKGAGFSSTPAIDSRDYFKIYSRQNGLVLKAKDGALNDATPVVQAREDKDDMAQQWRFVGLGGGVFKIVNRRNGLVLEVIGSSIENGGAIDLYRDKYDPNGKSNQHWKITPVDAGFFRLTNTNSGLVLDKPNGINAEGAQIIQWAYWGTTGGLNQHWRIHKVSP